MVKRAVKNGDVGIVISFGHKESGKSYTMMGENGYQLQRNITEPIEQSDDSRGLILRCLHDIKSQDPSA
jgi:hypothetical protein